MFTNCSLFANNNEQNMINLVSLLPKMTAKFSHVIVFIVLCPVIKPVYDYYDIVLLLRQLNCASNVASYMHLMNMKISECLTIKK